jgi:hypothetical protein
MGNNIWKILAEICEGVTMALAARAAAWVAMISMAAVWKLIGHTIGEVALHIVGVMVAH